MEVALVVIVIAIVAVAVIVTTSRSPTTSPPAPPTGQYLSLSPSSYGKPFVGSFVLTNGSPMNYLTPVDNKFFTPFSYLTTVVEQTPGILSFNSISNEITIQKSGNYNISFNFTPSDYSIALFDGQIIWEVRFRLVSVSQNMVIYDIFKSDGGGSSQSPFPIKFSNIFDIPADVYTLTGTFVVNNTTSTDRIVPTGSARFSITTLY